MAVCGARGKVSHSRSDAVRVMRELKGNPDDPNSATLNVYKCSACRRWHVGHYKPWLRQAVDAKGAES